MAKAEKFSKSEERIIGQLLESARTGNAVQINWPIKMSSKRKDAILKETEVRASAIKWLKETR
jgi:hypothetical protein